MTLRFIHLGVNVTIFIHFHSHRLRSASFFAVHRHCLQSFALFPAQIIFNFSYLLFEIKKKLYRWGVTLFSLSNENRRVLASYLFKFWNGEHSFFWPNQMCISKIIHAKGFQNVNRIGCNSEKRSWKKMWVCHFSIVPIDFRMTGNEYDVFLYCSWFLCGNFTRKEKKHARTFFCSKNLISW